jgi:hypothetical protein
LALAGQGMKVIGTSTTEAGAASVTTALAAFPDCSGVVLNVDEGNAIGTVVDERRDAPRRHPRPRQQRRHHARHLGDAHAR